MRALLPEPIHEVDLHDHYARDWLDHGGVRGNMVASVDGAASAQGLSRGLQTPGDNSVFAALRDLADVVLVGAATAEAENYRPPHFTEARAASRREYRLRPQLPIALVSRRLGIDPSGPLFQDPANRPIVITCGTADTRALASVADVIVCGDHDIEFGEARRQLAARGLTRVLTEGGPRLLNRLIQAGELDELCLSVSPLLAGPSTTHILTGTEWTGPPRELELNGLLEEDGALFLRYAVRRTVG